jgi:hypothetical protein
MEITLKDKIKIIFRLIQSPKTLKALLSQRYSGYLIDQGWFNSFISNTPVDSNNEPIPWLTYPFIDFIAPRLSNQLTVFEFGAGNSTLFFAKKVKEVFSVEHNKDWYNRISKQIQDNVNLVYKEIDEEYPKSIQSLNKKFDIIIIDAEERVNCVKNSLGALTDAGVIVLDDSERSEYKEAIDFLRINGFKQLDFWGISAGILFKKCTSLFYKSKNCLEI